MTGNPLLGCSVAVEGDASCGSSVLHCMCQITAGGFV